VTRQCVSMHPSIVRLRSLGDRSPPFSLFPPHTRKSHLTKNFSLLVPLSRLPGTAAMNSSCGPLLFRISFKSTVVKTYLVSLDKLSDIIGNSPQSFLCEFPLLKLPLDPIVSRDRSLRSRYDTLPFSLCSTPPLFGFFPRILFYFYR